MDAQQKETLKHYLPELVDQVNPQQLLPYLPCLSTYSREEIDTAQLSKSRMYAVQILHNHLIRRPEGFNELVSALRHPGVDCTKLADLLVQHHTDCSSHVRGGPSFERHSSVRPDNTLYNGGMPGRQEVIPGAAGQQLGSSSATSSPARTPSKPKLNVDTTWEKLPPGVQTILKMFDAGNCMKTPDDLADLLGFTIEDMNRIKPTVPSGQSLTLAFIEHWTKSKTVTLGEIYKIFAELEREDILGKLQEKTGVKFERPEERGASGVDRYPQAAARSSAQMRNEVVIYDRADPNINRPSEKTTDYRKSVLNGEEPAVNRVTSVRLPQKHSYNVQDSRHNIIESDSTNDRFITQNAGGIQEQPIFDTSLEENGKKIKDMKGRFSGYKREDIITFTANDKPVGANAKIKPEDKARYPEKRKHCDTNEFSGDVPTGGNGSGGFCITESKQYEAKRNLEFYKNDLDRSNSTCSSDTENLTEDSLTDIGPFNDFNTSDQKGSKEDSCTNAVTKAGRIVIKDHLKERTNTDKVNTTDSNGNCLGQGCRSLDGSSKVNAATGNSENYSLQPSNFHTLRTSQELSNEDLVKAEFEKLVFEVKLENGRNLSSIFSQSDQHASRASSTRLTEENTYQDKTEKALSEDNFLDHSLEDNKLDMPKLSISSQEMHSIAKKRAKELPGHGILMGSQDTEFSNSYQENPSGSFQIPWDFSKGDEALSIDGEIGTRDWVLARQPYDKQFGQSDIELTYQVQQVKGEELNSRGGNKCPLEISGNVKNEEAIDDPVRRQNMPVTVDTGILGNVKVQTEVVRQGSEEVADNRDSDIGLNVVDEKQGAELLSNKGNRHALVEGRESETVSKGNCCKVNESKASEKVNHGNEKVGEDSNSQTNTNQNEFQTDNRQEALCIKDSLETVFKVIRIAYDNSL